MVNYPVSMQFVRICCSLIYHCMIQIIILLILAHDQLCLSHQVHNTILRKEISENLKTLYSSFNSFLVFCLFSYHFFLKEYSDCNNEAYQYRPVFSFHEQCHFGIWFTTGRMPVQTWKVSSHTIM